MDVKQALERAIEDVSDHDAKLALQQYLIETFSDEVEVSPTEE